MNAYRQIVIAVIGFFLIIIIGTIGFHIIENLSFFSSLWLTIITVLTVGYGDASPHSNAGKVFAIFIIPMGIGLATYVLSAVSAAIIEGDFSKSVGRKRMQRAIGKLENHVIICGLGRVGRQVVKELQRENMPIVVIDQHASSKEEYLGNILYIEGDATDDKVLYLAGIERACGIVAALPQDTENVYIALTAKGIRSDIHVVARAEKEGCEEKLRRAGADRVINPSSIGGRRIAMSILKPVSFDYMDQIFHEGLEEFIVEEIILTTHSKLLNRSLIENRIREEFGVTIIAIKRGGRIISNPPAHEIFSIGDMAIVFGLREQLARFAIAAK